MVYFNNSDDDLRIYLFESNTVSIKSLNLIGPRKWPKTYAFKKIISVVGMHYHTDLLKRFSQSK